MFFRGIFISLKSISVKKNNIKYKYKKTPLQMPRNLQLESLPEGGAAKIPPVSFNLLQCKVNSQPAIPQPDGFAVDCVQTFEKEGGWVYLQFFL